MSTKVEKIRALKNSIRIMKEMLKNPRFKHSTEKLQFTIQKGEKVLKDLERGS